MLYIAHQCLRRMSSVVPSRPQAEQGKTCQLHKNDENHIAGGCAVREPEETDIFVACSPCQPYSALRSHGVDAESHNGYAVMFADSGSVISHCEKLLPSVFISEQVLGFQTPRKSSNNESPLETFVNRISNIKRSSGEMHFVAYVKMTVDSDTFIEGSRPRSPGLYLFEGIHTLPCLRLSLSVSLRESRNLAHYWSTLFLSLSFILAAVSQDTSPFSPVPPGVITYHHLSPPTTRGRGRGRGRKKEKGRMGTRKRWRRRRHHCIGVVGVVKISIVRGIVKSRVAKALMQIACIKITAQIIFVKATQKVAIGHSTHFLREGHSYDFLCERPF
jgi:hypothetical protein